MTQEQQEPEMARRLAQHLMCGVYVAFSAVVSLSAQNEILDIWQFDTAFGQEEIHIAPDAEQVWLMTNHPEGSRVFSEQDRDNLHRIRQLAGNARVRAFIVGEDIPCIERYL